MVSVCKCPCCDAPIEYDSEKYSMSCDFCGKVLTVEEAQAQLENYKVEFEDKTDNKQEDIQLEVYVCSTCGAEILTEENTSATFCSYCGNPTLIRNRLEGVLKPAYVIPFKMDREKAKEAYKSWINKGGVFTPKTFKTEAVIEKITGLYAPFWLYDYTGSAVINARAKKVSRRREGSYMCTYTSHYDIHRNFDIGYVNVPADASEKLPDKIMDLLEPFDYSEMVEFKMPYLSGYYSDKYSYDSEQMKERVEERIEKYIMTAGRNTITGYDGVEITSKDIHMKKEKADYVLLPVWILTYKYGGETFTFTMNGQTGKIVAERPKSRAKMFAWFAGISGGVFTALIAVAMILGIFVF